MQARTFGAISATLLSGGAGALTQSPEYSFLALPMAITAGVVWIIVLVVFIVRNRKHWRAVMASWYFVIICFVVALFAVGAASYGLALQTAQIAGTASSQDKPPQTAAPISIPGIPATKAGLTNILDNVLPELSGILSGDGVKARDAYLDLPRITAKLLVNDGRDAADKKVAQSINAMDTFIQDITSFQNRHRLDSALIEWLLGDWNVLQHMSDSAQLVRRDISTMTLPPSQSPDMLMHFFSLGKDSAIIDPQVGTLNELLSNIEMRMKKTRADFEKRLAAS
jgi:hypothetical protein